MAEKLHQSSTSEIADENQESLSTTINDRLIQVLSEMSQPIHWQDIHLLAETDGLGEININSIRSALAEMIRKKLIVRINRGVYSLPEFVGETYSQPQSTLKERVEGVLRSASQPLPVWEINLQIEEDGYGEFLTKSISTILYQMTRSGEIVKTDRGFYCLPEYTTQEYESPEKTLSQRMIAALWQAGRPLAWQELHGLAETDNLGKINPGSVISSLSTMIREKLVVRVERGIYSLPEFSYASEKKPDSYITKAEITSKVVNILNEAGESAPTGYVHILLTTGNLRGLSLKHISDMLNRLAQEDETNRRIARTAKDTYCLLEIATRDYKEPSLKIEDRLLSMLQAAGRPLHRYDMYRRAEKSEHEAMKLSSVSSILQLLANEGLITRAARGVYSMPESADECYELPKVTIKSRVYFTLLEAEQPLHWQEAHRQIEQDGYGPIEFEGTRSQVIKMVQEGMIVRVSRGVYSLPKFADKDYERPIRITISVRLRVVLEEAAQPLHWREVHQLVEQDGYGLVDLENVKVALQRMVKKGTAVRALPGVYSLPEFADKDYKLPKIAANIRLKTVLEEAGQPLHWQEAHRQIEQDGYGLILPKSTSSELAKMVRKGIVVRVSRSVYSLPEFANKDYESVKPVVNIRLKAILEKAGQPLHWQEAHRRVEQDGYGPINPRSINSALLRMVEKEAAVRVSPGVYSMPEFIEK